MLLSSEPEELPVPLAVPFPTSDDTEILSSPSSTPTAIDVDILAKRDPSHIRAVLRQLHVRQNEIDQVQDIVDLRSLMRMALQANSDVEMMEVLQVGRDEMPEAIKTLQRALEREVEKESSGDGATTSPSVSSPAMARRVSVKEVTIPVPALPGSDDGHESPTSNVITRRHTVVSIVSASSGSSSGGARDTLDREFIESGIDALRRMSDGTGIDLPSWTITR